MRTPDSRNDDLGAEVYFPHGRKKARKLGEYKLIRRLVTRGYDEEWLVQSVTGAYLLAEVVRRSKLETLAQYEQAFAALKLYGEHSHSHQNLEPILHGGGSVAGDYFYYVTGLADDLSGSDEMYPRKYRPSSLDSIVARSNGLSIDDCINVGLDAAAALDYLHRHGVIHRNVKPERIHFSRRIAKLSGIWLVSEIGDTEAVGTPGFIPPEGHGWPGGDLYSLGKTLERIATPRGTAFSTPAGLEHAWKSFLNRICHPDPACRYTTAANVSHELSQMRNYLEPRLESQYFSCFISYSHQERDFALKLFEALRCKGIRCWLDAHQLLPGDDIHEGIEGGIRIWDKVLLCASKASLTSWWVDNEINRAFQKEAEIMKQRGKKVLALIPLNLDDFLFAEDYTSGKRAEIRSRVAANFVGWEKDEAIFHREVNALIRALRVENGGREKSPVSKL